MDGIVKIIETRSKKQETRSKKQETRCETKGKHFFGLKSYVSHLKSKKNEQ